MGRLRQLIVIILSLQHFTSISCHHAFAPGFQVKWKSDSENVTFLVSAKTRGWIGFGISPDGGMAGSDMAIGGVRDDGTSYFGDYYTTGNTVPLLDERQDWHLLAYGQNGSHTWLQFTRKLETCDKTDWRITRDTQRLIYAWGKTDDFVYHGKKRGTKQKMLLDPPVDVDFAQFQTFDMQTSMVLPQQPVNCRYTLHKSPKSDVDILIGGVSSIFNLTGVSETVISSHLLHDDDDLPSEISREYTHNVNLYNCQTEDPEFLQDWWLTDNATDCTEKYRQMRAKYCSDVVFGWSTGFHVTVFPEDVGYKLKPNSYYVLETQYVNPRNLKGILMDTGHRIYYSDLPRMYEAGYLMIGSSVNYTQVIPPASPNFTQITHCTEWCTKHWPEAGLNVFAIKFRAHKGVKELKMRIFRDDAELPYITDNFRVDYTYKEIRVLREEIKLMPNDHLLVECFYDTTANKRRVAVGGVTSGEMCMAYLYYYPKYQDVVECRSQPPGKPILDFFGIEAMEKQEDSDDPVVIAPENLKGRMFSEVVKKFRWTPEAKNTLQELHRYTPHEVECLPHMGEQKSYATYPKLDKEWDIYDSCKAPKKNTEEHDDEHGDHEEHEVVETEQGEGGEHGDHEHGDHEHGDHEHADHEHGDHEHGDHQQEAPTQTAKQDLVPHPPRNPRRKTPKAVPYLKTFMNNKMIHFM